MATEPSRTFETEADYRDLYRRLVAQCGRETGSWPKGPMDLVDWFLSADGQRAPASNRRYRSAILFGLGEQLMYFPRKATAFEPAIARLSETDPVTGRRPQPEPSEKADRQTSSSKRKSLGPAQATAVSVGLEGRRHKYGWLASGFVRFGPDLALRPGEWKTARVFPGFLVVRNAKATNGRACGRSRALDLRDYPHGYLEDLKVFLRDIRGAVESAGSWSKVAEGINRALRDASVAAGGEFPALRKSPVVLYTFRHVGAARMKAATDMLSVAAMLGHGSDETALRNYAKAHTARGWRMMLTRPVRSVRERVESVRAKRLAVRAQLAPSPHP